MLHKALSKAGSAATLQKFEFWRNIIIILRDIQICARTTPRTTTGTATTTKIINEQY